MRSVPAFVLLLVMPLLALAQDKDKGTETKIGGLKSTTPADWKKEKPANLLRSYQFKLPAAKDAGEAEVTVYPESQANPEKAYPRWKAQFVPPEGKTVDDISKATKWDVKGVKVNVLDVAGGTWRYKERPQDPASKEMLLEGYRVVWVIVAEDSEATHIRLSGPKESVDQHYAAFEKWVKGLK